MKNYPTIKEKDKKIIEETKNLFLSKPQKTIYILRVKLGRPTCILKWSNSTTLKLGL